MSRLTDRPHALKRTTARRRFRWDRRGTVAVEFALVSVPLFALLLFLMMVCYRLYVQAALDYVASQAGRMLAVDAKQTRSSSANSFQALTLCPLIAPFLSCGNVTASLISVTDYSAASYTYTGTPPFGAGQSSSLMLLHLTYTLPSLNWPSPTGSAVMNFIGTSVDAYYPYQNEY